MAKRVYTVRDENSILPQYQTQGAAGFDFHANLFLEPVVKANGNYNKNVQRLILYRNGRALIKTGIKMQIPEGFVLDIRPRSGNALKHGIMLTNSPGTIDSDYRGDIGVIITNTSDKPFVINHGDRIAQGVLLKYDIAKFTVVEELEESDRGEGGFGHTDNKENVVTTSTDMELSNSNNSDDKE